MENIKKYVIRVLILAVALIHMLTLCACGDVNSTDTKSSESNSMVPLDTPSEIQSETSSESLTETPSETSPITPKPQEGILEVTWLNGYVGSSTNTSGNVNKISQPGSPTSTYSFSEVFTVPKAGTKVWFTDAASGFASSAAYVFSSWKSVNGKWEIDLDGANFSGGDKAVTTDANPGKTYTYVTSKDNENLRVCYRSDLKNNEWKVMAHPTVYYLENAGTGTAEEALKIEKERNDWLEAQRQKYYSDALDKISMYALGDSYFGGSSLGSTLVWPSLLAKKYNMTYTNYGVGGTLMAQKDGKSDFITNRWSKMSANAANIILVNGGRNDYSNNVPIGENTDTSLTTFKGALNNLIDNLKKKYPDAMLVFVTPWNFSGTNGLGLTSDSYANAMKEVCGLKGVRVFDAHDVTLSHVDMTKASFRTQYCLTSSDVSHLNEEGHRFVLEYFEKFIADEYVKFLAEK